MRERERERGRGRERRDRDRERKEIDLSAFITAEIKKKVKKSDRGQTATE